MDMNNKIKLIFLLLPALTLLSCATPYVKSGEVGGIQLGGYDNSTVNGNTAIVSFNANTRTSPAQVRNYLLYRAAEVSIDNGYDYFVITSISTSRMNIDLKVKEVNEAMSPNVSMLSNKYQVEKIKSYRTTASRAATCDSQSTSGCTAHSSTAVIKMFNGTIPAGLPRAYTALDVMAHDAPAN